VFVSLADWNVAEAARQSIEADLKQSERASGPTTGITRATWRPPPP